MSRSDNLPRRFARIYTAAITDVMDEMGLRRRTLPSTIQPLAASMRTAGYAFAARESPPPTTPPPRGPRGGGAASVLRAGARPHAGSPRERDQTLRRFLGML